MARKADNNEYMDSKDFSELGIDNSDNSGDNKQHNNRPNKNKQRNNKGGRPNQNQQRQNNKQNSPKKRTSGKSEYMKHKQPKKEEEAPTIPTLGDWSVAEAELSESKKRSEEVASKLSDVTPDELLANITVDLDNIDIFSDIDYDINKENTNFILNNRPTYEVRLGQSAYIAHMQSLSFSEITAITQSVGSDYAALLARYQLYHDKINTDSIGINKDFEKFRKFTSVYDVPTLEFGIYQITFPGSTKFNIQCGKCEHVMKEVEVDNSQLISVKDEEIYERMSKNINSITDEETMNEFSLLSHTKRVMLDHSKIVLDIKIPNLDDHLSLMSSLNGNLDEEEKKAVEEMQYLLLHIKDMYIPDSAHLKETGKARFIPIESSTEVASILRSLDVKDGKKLIQLIDEQVEKYNIYYAIQPIKCTNCGEETNPVPIDVSDLLFQHLLQEE